MRLRPVQTGIGDSGECKFNEFGFERRDILPASPISKDACAFRYSPSSEQSGISKQSRLVQLDGSVERCKEHGLERMNASFSTSRHSPPL